MAKRTVEMEDTLDDRVSGAKDELREYFKEQLDEGPDISPDDLWPHDRIFEIAYGAVPIYTSEIDDTYYLHGDDLDQAYDDAGIGKGDEPNHKAVTIFCYIEQALWEYWRELCSEADDEADEEV